VFLDTKRLQDGRDFSVDFSSALVASRIVVPIISWQCLQRMLLLAPDSDVDNVLLEWTLILELLVAGGRSLALCLPVVLGRVGDENLPAGPHISSLFEEKVIDALPNVVCGSVVARAAEILRKHGKAESCQLRTRTVRQTVKQLLMHLGAVESSEAGKRDVHYVDTFERDMFRRCANKVLECVEKAELAAPGYGGGKEAVATTTASGEAKSRTAPAQLLVQQLASDTPLVVVDDVEDGVLASRAEATLLRELLQASETRAAAAEAEVMAKEAAEVRARLEAAEARAAEADARARVDAAEARAAAEAAAAERARLTLEIEVLRTRGGESRGSEPVDSACCSLQ
jgi:hypothetical protein